MAVQAKPTKPARPATIHDIAKLAKVSKSTVSNVIRGARGIAPKTKDRVQAAIETLGYRPNVLARQLVQQKTNVLGMVIGDLSNPFFSEMAKRIEIHASNRGYRTMFCNTQIDEHLELAGLRSLLDYRVAGIIFLAYAGDAESAELIVESGVPAVFVTCSADWGDVVSVDDEKGARLATEHLIQLGHRRIAYVADPTVEDAADEARQAGYGKAIEKAGLEKAVFHWLGHDGKALKEAPIEDVLLGEDRFTAIFSSNDLGAIELLECADQLGIRVPTDLSIVGYDDVMLAGLRRINLTTVAQPKEMMAQLAVNTVVARIEGELPGGNLRQIVECQLVVRGSTAPPPQRRTRKG
jgi:DNA-binding LacI/PurR family transcriptional regulator